MTIAPAVELRFNPTDLRPQDLPRAGAFLGSPADAIEASLAVTRAAMVDHMKEEVRGIANPTHAQLLRIADLAWQASFWRFRKISAPVMADAYVRAYIAADAGDVPMSVIYELSEKHAEKVGEYFHESSRVALSDGFNTLVNRRVPAKAAADTVLDAYGLTPRQMRAYTAATRFTTPVSDVLPRPVKAKARAYIDKAFTSRIRKLSQQEEHNIDEQAKQFAWMWLQQKGKLNPKAMKLWITAKDERVCEICGPLHNKRVLVGNQFKTAHGDFWTPGLHPNCRCVVRLLEMRFTKSLVGVDLHEFNREHPRAQHGQFGHKQRPRMQTKTIDVDEAFASLVDRLAPGMTVPQFREQAARNEAQYQAELQAEMRADPRVRTDPAVRAEFMSLIASQPEEKKSLFTSPYSYSAPVDAKVTAQRQQQVAAAVAETMAQIASPEIQTEFIVEVAAGLRMAVAADPEPRTKPSVKVTPKTKPQTKPKTQVKAPAPQLDETVFGVITNVQLAEGDLSRVRLDDGIQFTTDEIQAAELATGLIRDRVEAEFTDAYAQGLTLESKDAQGNPVWATLKKEDLEDTVDWLARNATQHTDPDYDPDSIGDDQVTLDWRDEEGNLSSTERHPYSWIGESYDIDQSRFQVYVVWADEAHLGEGAVNPISGTAGSRARGYTLDGEFEQVPDTTRREHIDHTFGVTTYKVKPTGPDEHEPFVPYEENGEIYWEEGE